MLRAPSSLGAGQKATASILRPSARRPNARLHLLPKAAATQERRLAAVRCKPWLGAGVGGAGTAVLSPSTGPLSILSAFRSSSHTRSALERWRDGREH